MPEDLLRWIGARRVVECIQSLWGGHGELLRVAFDDGRTAIVKWARPPAATDTSSTRKRRSYDVELAFYRSIAARCDRSCRVPALIAARRDARESVLVLEDLDAAGFGSRVEEATGTALDAALRWLASFHARFLGESAGELWSIGTYWHLDTRKDELPNIADAALHDAAPKLARRLASARYQTIVHGDPKEANFCFTADHADVAAVDFQYTGRACGIVDVAYLLYGRSDENDPAHLDRYFEHLRSAAGIDIAALELEWRELYPIARQDFRRFLAGWRR
ncbi:MAG: phosphotransferase [Deltaproteobacteria bacterium]|nr:phosphotransferase [Deltaproteobacteria bacterium]